MGYIYILGTIAFTVYGQLIIKWRMNLVRALPENLTDKIFFLMKTVFDPFVFSGLLAAFVASLFWMAAMTQFRLSYAYPFMSLSFICVFFLSAFIFREPVSMFQVGGLILVIGGIILSSVTA